MVLGKGLVEGEPPYPQEAMTISLWKEKDLRSPGEVGLKIQAWHHHCPERAQFLWLCAWRPFVLGGLHSKGPVWTKTRDWAEGNGWLEGNPALQLGRMGGT
jgi:hypothetical protein